MVVTRHLFNNSEINPPKNWKELEINLNYDRDNGKYNQTLSITDWEFVRENTDKIQEHTDSGLNGGVGIFEGIPYKIEIERNGQIETPFDGYLDLTEEHNLSGITSTVKAKERHGIDFFNDVADSVTFEYLFKEAKIITTNDFIYQPYILNSVPDYKEAAIMIITSYVLVEQIRDNINKFSQLIAELSNPFEATAIIRAILLVAYIAFLILAAIKVIKQIINLIIQPVKYHAGMYLKTLLTKGCEHFGYSFESEILDSEPFSKAVVIPEKFYVAPNTTIKEILGFTKPSPDQEGYFKGSLGDLMRICKTMFNAKFFISGKTIKMLRRDKPIGNVNYTLPDVYEPYFKLNTTEFNSNILVSFEYDTSDKNTVQEYKGVSYQTLLQPKSVINKDLVLMRGLKDFRIPLALARTKKELTLPEKLLNNFEKLFSKLCSGLTTLINGIIKAVNTIIKIINKIIKALKVVGIKVNWEIKPVKPIKIESFANTIENRIGMMKIETDFVNRPKIYLLDKATSSAKNKINPNNDEIFSAKYLYNNFHFVDSFLPSIDKPNANQYYLKEYEKVPFVFSDYLKVKENNFIYVGSDIAEVEELNWNPYEQVARIRLRINKLYTNNLKETTYEPTGA